MSDESEEYGGRLIIKDLKKEDAGDYECFLASGQTSRVRLMVNIDENHKQVNSHEVNKEIDANVELICQINDKDNLRWRKLNGVNYVYL
jgi:3-keto-L-gulonate-6-phosphate decarboxylase